MKKKIVKALLLTATVCLVGCGKEQVENTPVETTPVVEETQEETLSISLDSVSNNTAEEENTDNPLGIEYIDEDDEFMSSEEDTQEIIDELEDETTVIVNEDGEVEEVKLDLKGTRIGVSGKYVYVVLDGKGVVLGTKDFVNLSVHNEKLTEDATEYTHVGYTFATSRNTSCVLRAYVGGEKVAESNMLEHRETKKVGNYTFETSYLPYAGYIYCKELDMSIGLYGFTEDITDDIDAVIDNLKEVEIDPDKMGN